MRIDSKKCCSGKLLKKCGDIIGKKLFKVFNDDSRQRIFLILLSGGEMTVNEVSGKININQSNVSRHLNLLKESGVADSRKEGREIYYYLNINELKSQFKNLISILDKCC